MATIDERIAALQTRLKQEQAKKQKIEARKRAIEARAERSKDTRRKILVGAALLSKVEHKEIPEANLRAMLASFLTRDDDRALFNLPPLQPAHNLQAGGDGQGGISHPAASYSEQAPYSIQIEAAA